MNNLSKFTKSHIILLLIPLVVGVVGFKFISDNYRVNEKALIARETQSYELSGNLIAEKIQGDLTSVDLLLLLLQSKALSVNLSNSKERDDFFTYITTRARFYTNLDNISIFNSRGDILYSTEQNRDDSIRNIFTNLEKIHIENLLPFSIIRGQYSGLEEIIISRMFYHEDLNDDLIVVGEVCKNSLMTNFESNNAVIIDEAVVFDENGNVFFSLGNEQVKDLGSLLGINRDELISLGGTGIHGGTNNVIKDNKVITIVQLEEFSLFLGIKNNIGLELDKLNSRKSLALTLISLGSFLVFLIVLSINLNELEKAKIKQQAYSRLEELVNIRTKELKVVIAEKEKIASTDALTGLVNRRSMAGLLKSEIERAERYNDIFSLVMCDIDHFKNINDTLGHDMGDDALKYIVSYLIGYSRKTDIVARWGGEEFLILLYKTDNSTAYTITDKIRELIESNPWREDYTITCSFGISTYIKGDTSHNIIKRADEALYKAKETRNCVKTSNM